MQGVNYPKRYSEMTEYELRKEIEQLAEQARKAEQMGMVNEFAVLERKSEMAQSYLLDPAKFEVNVVYDIKGAPGTKFKVTKIDGVMAWGNRLDEEDQSQEVALPISLLIK